METIELTFWDVIPNTNPHSLFPLKSVLASTHVVFHLDAGGWGGMGAMAHN